MDKQLLSPYIRRACYSVLRPCGVERRIIYDYELIFVKDGMCRVDIDGRDYLCRKNHVIFLRPGITHGFHPVEGVQFVQPHIHFDAVYSEKSRITPISFIPRESMTAEQLALIQPDVFADVPIPDVFCPEDLSTFQKLFFGIIDAYSTGTWDVLEQKADMLRLLRWLCGCFEHPTRSDTGAEPLMQQVKSFIEENYADNLSLDALAETFGINKFTLIRKFKRIYGINVMQYYNQKRMEAAKHMLRDTNLTVKSIGEALCFTDAYSFSRFFKSCAGCAPSSYRNEAVKNRTASR